jgi:hypothetical protein
MTVYSVESVRVLDLNAAGVLLESREPVEPSSRATLRLSVSGASFVAPVEILRMANAPAPTDGFRVAAQFLAITPKHRQLIERFISQ